MADSRPTPRPDSRDAARADAPFYRAVPIRNAAPSPSQRLEELRRKATASQGATVRAPQPPRPTEKPQKANAKNRDAERDEIAPRRAASVEVVAKRQARAESRAQLIERLSNPLISLQEAALLLNVCPATVRRWSDAGALPHVRTEGNQRRFRWRDVQLLMPEASRRR